MISLTPLILHLTPAPIGFDAAWFRQVGGAAEYAQIRPDALPLPACWIVRAGEKVSHVAERTEDTNFAFDVVIAIENARTHKQGDTDDLLLKYRQAVKNLLLGWELEADTRPIQFEGGRVLEYTDGDLYWADRYSFNALVTNYLPDPPPYQSTNYTGAAL